MNGIFIRLKSLWLALAAIVAATGAWAQGWDTMPQERAARLFAEAQRVCDADGGRLWGENIWGEVVLVRDADKLAFCNDARLLPGARKEGELYCGTLDSNLVVAGNAARLRGVDVAIVPMFEMSDSALVEVFVHELFHRFQNRHYGSDEMVYDNGHVDTKAGRTLDGNMQRGRIGTKIRMDITCRPLTAAELQIVLDEMVREHSLIEPHFEISTR